MTSFLIVTIVFWMFTTEGLVVMAVLAFNLVERMSHMYVKEYSNGPDTK